LGQGDRAFLASLRSLGRKGLAVHAINTGKEPLPASRYIRKIHPLPFFDEAPEEWLAGLISLMKNLSFDLVLPTDDQSVIPIQQHQNQLREHGPVYVLNDKAYEVSFDKGKSRQLAESLGLPVAKGCPVHSYEEASEWARSYGWPLIAKPLSSFVADNLSDKRMVQTIRDETQLQRLFSKQGKAGATAYIFEQYFQGVGVGVEFIARNGKPLYYFQHERVHEPPEGGGSSYRKSVAVDPRLEEFSTLLIRSLEYDGIGMVEFKMSPDRKSFIFIEINGRFWGSLPLAIAAGADFPFWLYKMIVNGETEFNAPYKKGLFARNFLKDLSWMTKNYRADGSDPYLITKPVGSVLSELLNPFLGREVFDTLALDDPRPFFSDLKQVTQRVFGKFLGAPLRKAKLSSSMARNDAKRLMSAVVRDGGHVLFICKGNICRSPFAESYATKNGPENVTWSSAGYYPVTDRSSPETARIASQKFGIALEDHRSRQIDQLKLDEYDLIVVFDHDNYSAVVSRANDLKDKTIFLGQLGNTSSIEIHDPYGHSQSYFEGIYGAIAKILDDL
jgi:protein-tyrosine-phosphatase/predicted ATP-grasp superfamily ATP-dependent carboligase